MTFDTPIDRAGSHSVKWDMMPNLYGLSPDEGLAMWVADMDFAAPPPVLDALQRRVAHGVLGYAHPWESLKEAVVEGIVTFPEALIKLFTGENFGKLVLKVAEA